MYSVGVSQKDRGVAEMALLIVYSSDSAEDGTLAYRLPGHTGTCTAVAMHHKEPISECEIEDFGISFL
jgi:hypothetical protein